MTTIAGTAIIAVDVVLILIIVITGIVEIATDRDGRWAVLAIVLTLAGLFGANAGMIYSLLP